MIAFNLRETKSRQSIIGMNSRRFFSDVQPFEHTNFSTGSDRRWIWFDLRLRILVGAVLSSHHRATESRSMCASSFANPGRASLHWTSGFEARGHYSSCLQDNHTEVSDLLTTRIDNSLSALRTCNFPLVNADYYLHAICQRNSPVGY